MTEGLQNRRDAGQEGNGKGGMQDRWDAGKQGLQERRDEGKEGCRKGDIQELRDTKVLKWRKGTVFFRLMLQFHFVSLVKCSRNTKHTKQSLVC